MARMNAVQKAYVKAMKAQEKARAAEAQAEKDWIIANGIKMSDGTYPDRIYMLDNISEREFDYYSDKLMENTNYHTAYCAMFDANKIVEKAEDDLIEYSLSIVPTGIANTLRKVKNEYKYRQKMIEIVMRLDTSTVPM